MLYSKLRAGRPPCFRTPRRGCSHLFLAFARARARARACFYAFRMQNLSEAVSMGRLGRGVCYIQNTTNQVLFKRCGALRCVAVRCGAVWRGVAWCGVVRRSACLERCLWAVVVVLYKTRKITFCVQTAVAVVAYPWHQAKKQS